MTGAREHKHICEYGIEIFGDKHRVCVNDGLTFSLFQTNDTALTYATEIILLTHPGNKHKPRVMKSRYAEDNIVDPHLWMTYMSLPLKSEGQLIEYIIQTQGLDLRNVQ